MSRINNVPPSSMSRQSSNDPNWDQVMQLLLSDLKLMDGNPQPAVENQFQNFLNALQPYISNASSGTKAAFNALQAAFENYQANRSIGTGQISNAINQLLSNPPNLTNAQFKTATAALIASIYNDVSPPYTNQNAVSDYMNIITTFAAYSSQVPPAFVQMLSSSNTAFMTAYNNFMSSQPPTLDEIADFESQLDNLKATLS